MKISVVIPTYNRAEMVCKCIGSVLECDWDDIEVIVVDDCSPDDTAQRVKERFGAESRVKYIRNPKNVFQAASRNNGAKVADGKYLFFLDDDNIVDAAVLRELVSCFERHPDAGLVAPVAIHRRPGKNGLVWTLGSSFNRWTSQPDDHLPEIPEAEIPQDVVDFPTTYSPNAFMVPRKVFDELGGFEESLVMIYEESDFGWRIMERGYSGWIAARARTSHFGFVEKGCASELRQLGIEKPARTYCFARNRIRFARRHFNFFQALSVTLVFAPLSAAYYVLVALRNRRPDIAWSYIKGTVAGILGWNGDLVQ